MTIITNAAALAAARPETPAVLIAAEGADFLDGDAAILETAHAAGKLRHLQLTHYRVNELGDIQTETPVHGGLTDFGAEVIRRCQRMGIIVDVAHGTEALVRRAVDVSTRPLVLSHTSLTTAPRPLTRLITAGHARLVAGTGGVIGIWPPTTLFPDLDALGVAVARMADAVGAAHVGIGSDMMGLVVPSALPRYELGRACGGAAAPLHAGGSKRNPRRQLRPGGTGVPDGYGRLGSVCVRHRSDRHSHNDRVSRKRLRSRWMVIATPSYRILIRYTA